MKSLYLIFFLTAGSSDQPLHGLLDRVGSGVRVFWDRFSSVACTEQVFQTKLAKNGKVLARQESNYDYIIFMTLRGGDLMVEESRVLQKYPPPQKAEAPLLVTGGFPTLQLVFHPFYQGSFEYAAAGEELLDGVKMLRIRFRHIAGTRSTSALRLRGRDFPLDLRGDAWINPASYTITRITGGLISPAEDLGLHELESDVRYGPVRFTASAETYWLPLTASIEVQTARQRWRNTHRFTNYKLFSIESETKVQP
jgi:hypothetical protein